LYDMLAAIDYLDANPTEIVATGVCWSAAVPVLASGIRRFVTPRCRLMVHPLGQAGGPERKTRAELVQDVRELARLKAEYCRILGRRTKKSAKWWAGAMERETWMTAREARRVGLVDEVAG
jgi:ATP-dependent Clp protease protease subunit